MAYKRKVRTKRPIRRGTYKKKRLSRPNVKKMISQAINKNIETKESVTQITDGQEIWHNNFITITNNLLKTTQGVSDPANTNTNNRIGDSINLKGVSIKMMVELNERYSDVTFRLMVVRAARNDSVDRATLFVGQSGNKMLDKFNDERFTLLAQKWFKITARNPGTIGGQYQAIPGEASGAYGISGTSPVLSRATKIVKMWIPGNKFKRNGIITYDNGWEEPKFFDYHCVLFAYSNYSTLQDVYYIARLNDCVINTYYKDA